MWAFFFKTNKTQWIGFKQECTLHILKCLQLDKEVKTPFSIGQELQFKNLTSLFWNRINHLKHQIIQHQECSLVELGFCFQLVLMYLEHFTELLFECVSEGFFIFFIFVNIKMPQTYDYLFIIFSGLKRKVF